MALATSEIHNFVASANTADKYRYSISGPTRGTSCTATCSLRTRGAATVAGYDEVVESDSERHHRRVSSRSVAPLAVIAGSFFVPTLKTCSTVQSPMELAVDGLVWVVPWYLGALVLAVATVAAVLRGRAPSRVGWGFGVVSVVACGLVGLVGLVGAASEIPSSSDDASLWLAVSATAAALGLGTSSLLRARRHGGWSAWTGLLLGYTSFALPLSALLVLFAYDAGHARGLLGPGAYAVMVATVTLAAILVFGRKAPA